MKLQFGWMLSPRDVKYSSLHLVINSIKLRLKGINLKMHGSLNLHLAGLMNEPVQHILSYI